MNTETGEVYRDVESIVAAQKRGEPLAEVSEKVAQAVEIGMLAMNRAERRAEARRTKKRGKGYTR